MWERRASFSGPITYHISNFEEAQTLKLYFNFESLNNPWECNAQAKDPSGQQNVKEAEKKAQAYGESLSKGLLSTAS